MLLIKEEVIAAQLFVEDYQSYSSACPRGAMGDFSCQRFTLERTKIPVRGAKGSALF
jgi:hypothetical protein